ncbi:MAG: PIG-L family deacetylase [Gemmataceae bacterium]|nr:PIG-L family deacetylase [Gemmataceae bacterium]
MTRTRPGRLAPGPFVAVVLAAAGLAGVGAETPNQQAVKTDLLVVTAHPDDETGMAAAMARYADAGKVVALACCTRGEGGGNGTGAESGPALGAVREVELRKCLATLGTRHLFFLDKTDFGYTESVRATFSKWDHDDALKRLVRVVRLLRPDVVCTMDPAPVGGQHGHHQAAGRLATEAFDAAADPAKFPELLRDEGLAPWRVRKLYWSVWGDGATVRVPTGEPAKTLAGGKTHAEVAWAAARHHRSQGFDKFFTAQPAKDPPPARPAGFVLVKSRVPVNPLAEKDLFGDLAGADFDAPEAAGDVLATSLAPKAAAGPVTVRLKGRENVEGYRAWLTANGLSRLIGRLPARATAVSGRHDNVVSIEATTTQPGEGSGLVLEVPAPLSVGPERKVVRNAKTKDVMAAEFQVNVPPGTPAGSYDLTARLGDASDTGKIEVVPSLTVAALKEPLTVDAGAAKWEAAGVKPVPIPHTNVVQGRVGGPAECGGRFFVGRDAAGLQVLVDVTDDTVCRNIAPDDIKAHWRSTSVELCLDPKPPGENTLTAFKLGVFPQDTTGTVRAARDADANPGELGRIGSKIRLASKPTPTGYVVEAHVPWAEAGFPDGPPPAGTPIGFNVILYHAGKTDARVGEDVGKARLAWSYWPGVPGRPEVWGRVTLP